MATEVKAGPKGRMVQGNPFVPSTTDMDGNPMVIQSGPNKGQPTQEYFISVAYPKSDPATLPYIMSIGAHCLAFRPEQFPHGLQPTPPTFGAVHPRFSSKIMDGDGRDWNGKNNADKDGFAGHWIVRYSSSFAPKVYEKGKYSDMERVDIDVAKHTLLKRGFFITVGASFDTNASDTTPGIKSYLNMIEIQHAGPEITSGPDAGSVFGGAPASAPSHAAPPPPVPTPAAPPSGIVANPGVDLASMRAVGWTDDLLVQHGHATRAAPLPVTPPAPPPVPTPAASTPPVPVPAAATPSPSSPPPPPYDGFIPTGRVMLPAAQGATYEQLVEKGWTDALMVQHGMMAPQ